jgi:hypothetical protein
MLSVGAEPMAKRNVAHPFAVRALVPHGIARGRLARRGVQSTRDQTNWLAQALFYKSDKTLVRFLHVHRRCTASHRADRRNVDLRANGDRRL